MEKRRVRLYKAQEGGQPSADMLGYPGAQQEQAPQMSEDQLVQSITQDISNDLPKEAIVAKLVNVMGIDMMQASQYVESVYTMLQNQMEEPDEDEEETPEQVEQQTIEEQGIVPMKKMVMHDDLVEDDEDEDLTDLEDENMVKYGGMPKASDGLETGWGNRYEVQFPGLEAYLPSNMEDQFDNPAADIAWQAPEETILEEETIDYAQPVVDPSEFSMGGFKTKRGYVNSVMKLVKKQLGGDQEVESNDPDPIGNDLRKSNLNAFIGSIKKEGNMSLAKQQAEEQYDQMMAMHQQQMMQPDLSAFIPQNEMGMDQAQYGGMPRQQKKAIKQMQRTLRHLPVGNVGPVSKFDVQRSGIFGSPREYTIEFDNPLVQLANNPMLNANYGYGFGTKVTRTPARVKTEYVKNVVNSETLKEVAKATGSEAAAKATANTDTPSATAAPVTPAATPVVSSAPAAPVTVNRPPTNTVVTPPAVTPVNPPVAGNTYMPPAQFDYTPGLTNIQEGVANYVKPVVPLTMAERTKKASANPSGYQNVQLPGDKTLYYKNANGDWAIDDDKDEYPKVTNKEVLKKLNAGEAKGADYYTVKDKPGYVYRYKADGSLVKLKKNAEGTISNKPTAIIKPGDKSFKYIERNSELIKPSREIGGSVDNPFVNEYGDLQKFMGGGDDPSIPELNQADIDDVYSKDTTDPYMPQAQYGGMGKALTQMYFPANMPQRQYQSQMVKGPYDRASGSALASIPGYNPNAVVKDIKVTKEGLFGKPRRYTVTYNNNPTGNPDDRKLASKQIVMPQASAEGETTKEAFDNASMDRYARQDNRKNERWERQRKRRGYEDDSDFVPMSDEEYMAKVKANEYTPMSDEEYMAKVRANNGVAPIAQPTVAQPMPEYDPNDPSEVQYRLDNPYTPPTDIPKLYQEEVQEVLPGKDIKPIAAAPNNKGRQTEEFCFGNSCFEIPEQQATEYGLFDETPRLLKVYASKNNLDWYNPETDELDLSKVDEATLQEALKESSNSPSLRNKDLGNLQAYGNDWLKYQQGNQKAYGDLSSRALSRDASALEGFDSSEKYADFLNATGKTAEGKPNSIWNTRGPSTFNADETNSFVPEVGTTVGAIENYRPSRATDAYNYPQEQLSPEDYLFQEQTNSPEFLNKLKGKDAVDVVSAMFNRLGDMGEDALAEESWRAPVNAMPQYIDRPESSMTLQPGIQQPVVQPVVNKPTGSHVGTSTKPRIVAADKPKGLTAAQKKELAAQEARAIARKQLEEEYQSNENIPFDERMNKIKTSNTNERKIAAYKTYYDQPMQKLNGRLQASFRKLEGMNLPASQKKEKERIIYEQYYKELNKLEKSWEKKSKTIKQYGGEALDKFIPQALLGKETSVSMENNPAATEVDIDKDFRLPIVSSKVAGQQLFDQSRANIQEKANFQPDEYSVDYKSKSSVNDTQGALNSFNAAARGATGIINRLTGRKQEAQMYDNLNADNLYASDPSRDRGDYDTNSGLYRPDEEGQSWNSRSAQYGGSMYEEGGYVEGQDVYMTEDELEEFLANGGEVEYI